MVAPVNPRARYAGWVAPLCWCAVALEGFDLVVLGVVLPSLLKEPDWGSESELGVGDLGDRAGRGDDRRARRRSDQRPDRTPQGDAVDRHQLLGVHPAVRVRAQPEVFGLLRFLAGLGLGGVLPTALALINEYASRGRGGSATTTMMTGYHVGAVLDRAAGHRRHRAVRLAVDVRHRRAAGTGAGAADASSICRSRPPSCRPEPTASAQRPQAGTRQRPRPTQEPGRHAVPSRARPIDRRVLGDVVHGAAAGVRPEHLAAADHAGGRLRTRRRAGAAAGAERRCRARPADRRPGRGPDRQPPVDDRLVRRRRTVPGAAEHQAARYRRVRQRAARPACSSSARRCWCTPMSRMSTPRPPAAPLWARPAGSAGSAPSPGR